ncbi:MAG: hypothetical protein F4Z01_03565 [Gammaproteobacteria bacterium]|nr:hypothetical protein [Gammaproteobacteria bacterium]MYF37856.1 hypothetical protein [Gammaproteobacteria bacterium]
MTHFRSLKCGIVLLLVASALTGTCEVDSEGKLKADTTIPNTKLLSIAEIQEYRNARYESFLKSVSDTELSQENQELIATALSKSYSGIPLCSFSFTLDARGNLASPSEEEAVWIVSKSGGTIREDSKAQRHYRDAPFSYVPNKPFDLAQGVVVAKSRSTVKFRFPFTPRLVAPNLDSDAVRVLRKLEWIAELTVDTESKAPLSLLLTIEDDNERAHSPLVTFDVARVEFLYDYNASCEYYEVFSKLRHFEGTSIFSGDFLDKTIKTFKNVTCEQPVSYLLPEVKELEFLERY